IAVGDSLSCAIIGASGATDGELYCWGINDAGQINGTPNDNKSTPEQVSTASTWSSIEIGGHFATRSPRQQLCGVRADKLVCFGNSAPGAGGNGLWTAPTPIVTANAPTEVGPPQKVSLGLGAVSGKPGTDVACTLAGSEIDCWGENRFGELGLGFASLHA